MINLQQSGSSFEAPFEVGGADVAAAHGSLDVLLEQSSVALEFVGCFLV